MKEKARPSFVGLHGKDLDLWLRTNALAWRLAKVFDLPLVCVEPKRRPNGAGGLCYHDEGRISILLRRKARAYDGGAWSKVPRSWVNVKSTVAHELAHLIHPNHGKDFKALEAEILAETATD